MSNILANAREHYFNYQRANKYPTNIELFEHACRSGNIAIVQVLIQDKSFDILANNWAFREAVYYNNPNIVALLLQDGRIDPTADNNRAIREASAFGFIEIVKLLLQDARCEPSAMNNYALQCAKYKGYSAIVELLLQKINNIEA